MNNHQDSQNMRDLEPPLMKAVQAVLTETPPDDAISRVLERAKRLEMHVSGNRLVFRLARLLLKRPMAVGGVGLAAVAVLILLLLGLSSIGRLSAMERMAKELKEVKSYSYQYVEQVTIQRKDQTEPGLVNLTQGIYWCAPGELREELKIVLNGAVPAGYHPGQVDADIISISRTDQSGIFIDQSTKTYSREPKLVAKHTGSGSLIYPVSPLRTIQEQPGEVKRDLGSKQIHGKRVHGYMMAYQKSDEGQVEIWLDPETDLPVEVGWEVKDETTKSVARMSDFRWNIELDSILFNTTPPEGYTEITPPDDKASLAKIAEVLRMYSQLSGGQFPKIDTYHVNAKFDAEAIYTEMLKRAGFAGPTRPKWASDKKFLEIQQAKPGLELIAKILLNNTAGYQGSKVGPQDKDKPLLWWWSEEPEGYRVFYGDLHTQVLTETEGKGVIPPHPKIFDAPAEDHK